MVNTVDLESDKIVLPNITGTESEWLISDPVLPLGVWGFASDTKIAKIGDGIAPWSLLEAYTSPDIISHVAATKTLLISEAQSLVTAAELARDAAAVNANVYADSPSGLTATNLGDQFQVVSGGKITRYRHDSGPTATQVAEFPGAAVSKAVFTPCSESGSASALILTPKTGFEVILAGENIFQFEVQSANTGAVSIEVIGLNAGDPRQLLLPSGGQVPAGVLFPSASVFVRFKATGQFELILPQPIYLSKVPLSVLGTSTATRFDVENQVKGAIPVGGDSVFTFVAPFDRGNSVSPGMVLQVNGTEARQLLHPNGDQIEAGTWVSGDTLEIGAYNSGINGYPLITPTAASTSETPSESSFYTRRNSEIAALRGRNL